MEKNNDCCMVKKVQKNLLNWSKESSIRYPWRNTNDSYKILISEILLHKTDSKKVKNLYPKFMKKFPTIHQLYSSNNAELMKLIKDIGLFYRINRLKTIAIQIVDQYNGEVPQTKKELISLYGVGDYISNAVLCFAFKQRVPIVDTNVIRIYQRIFDVQSAKSRPRTDKKIWDFAEKLLPHKKYVEYNYALLDFASELCKAKKPLCGICIMNDMCSYYQKVN